MESVSGAVPAIPEYQQEPEGLTQQGVFERITRVRDHEQTRVALIAQRVGLAVVITLGILLGAALTTAFVFSAIALNTSGLALAYFIFALSTCFPITGPALLGIEINRFAREHIVPRFSANKGEQIDIWERSLLAGTLDRMAIQGLCKVMSRASISQNFLDVMNNRQRFHLMKTHGTRKYCHLLRSGDDRMAATASTLERIQKISGEQLARYLQRNDVVRAIEEDRAYLLPILYAAKRGAVESNVVRAQIARLVARYFPERSVDDLLREVRGSRITNVHHLTEELQYAHEYHRDAYAESLINDYTTTYVTPANIDALASNQSNPFVIRAVERARDHFVRRAMRQNAQGRYAFHFRSMWEEADSCGSELLKRALTDALGEFNSLCQRAAVVNQWPGIGALPDELDQVINPSIEL